MNYLAQERIHAGTIQHEKEIHVILHRHSRVRSTLLILSLVAVAAVASQGSFAEILESRGQFRDAAIDTKYGQLFVAVYDRNNVWRMDSESGKIATKISVGEGPVALAHDGTTLACVNRLGDSVTLIHLADLSIVATVEVGKGPSAVASIGGGRFLVSNTFSDALSLIETNGAITVSAVSGAPGVPASIATTSDQVVVLSRLDKQLYCYDRATLAPTKQIAPSDSIVKIVAGAGNTVIAASKTALYLIDVSSGLVQRTEKMAATDLFVADDILHVVNATVYQTYRTDLSPLDSSTLDADASVVVAGGSVVAFLAPKESLLQTRNLESLVATVVAPPALAPASPSPTSDDGSMVVVEATPVGEAPDAATSESSVPEEMPQNSAVVEAPKASEPMPADTTAMSAPDSSETQDTMDSTAQVDDSADKNTNSFARPSSTATLGNRGIVRKNPIVTRSGRAPSPGRPSASPLEPTTRQTITDALIRPTEFGADEGGFVAPDLTKPLENITFSSLSSTAPDAPQEYADFRAKHGEMHIQADTLLHRRENPVEIQAKGNVLITQEASSITADSILYKLEKHEATEGADAMHPVLEGSEPGTGSSLDQGHLTLSNAHIIEPTREITAEYADYDFQTGKGEITNAKGKAGIYYFSAEKLHLHGPQSLSGDNVWVTTCDREHPHYKIRLSDVEVVDGQPTAGTNARLQLGKSDTPLYLPKWRRGGAGGSPWNVSFDSGRQAETGYYVNVGQQYEVNPDLAVGPRIFATEKEGVGLGIDATYDFMENPASRFYRTKGEAHALYTTKDRGYVHWYHRYEYSNDLVVRAQLEHWGDENFYKDFYYDAYRNRSQPRSFANITYRRPSYIATGTVRTQTHSWFPETEQLPEFSYHLLERNIAENLYFSFDSVTGYYNREPSGIDAGRSVNTARLSYSWDPHPALAITPFLQTDGSYYTRDRLDNNSQARLGLTAGVTAQSRLSRTYAGRWGFSSFKHVFLRSMTYSYRPKTSLDANEIPQFDPLDSDFGRSRLEVKLDNVFYGRDAETGEVWQVGRISLYQGNDFWSETRKTQDYEIEIDVRPRPWWGFQFVGERQETSDEDNSLNRFSLARISPEVFEFISDDLLGRTKDNDFSAQFGDYNRILSQVYYDDTSRGGRVSGRVGFAYTETQSQVFNRDILYGMGYRLSDKWGIGFEHTYDLEDDNLRSQTYELRRSLHCWETAIRFRDRESGFDINVEFNIKAFPGSRVKF